MTALIENIKNKDKDKDKGKDKDKLFFVIDIFIAALVSLLIYNCLSYINLQLRNFHPEIYINFFRQETSPGEITTCILYFLSSVLQYKMYRDNKKKHHLLLSSWLLLSSFEELSIKSSFIASNYQNELNLHNLTIFAKSHALKVVYYLFPAFIFFISSVQIRPKFNVNNKQLILLFIYVMIHFQVTSLFHPHSSFQLFHPEQREFLFSVILFYLSTPFRSQHILYFIIAFVFIHFSFRASKLKEKNFSLLSFAQRQVRNKLPLKAYLNYAQKLQRGKQDITYPYIQTLYYYQKKGFLSPQEKKKMHEQASQYQRKRSVTYQSFAIYMYDLSDDHDELIKAKERLKLLTPQSCHEEVIVNLLLRKKQEFFCNLNKLSTKSRFHLRLFYEHNFKNLYYKSQVPPIYLFRKLVNLIKVKT